MLDKKIGEYFGSVQEYRIARDIYFTRGYKDKRNICSQEQ